MACPFGNLSFHIDAGARLYGSLRRSAIRGFSPALMRRDGVRLCLSRYLVSRMRAVSRFSESAVVHIAHSPAAQLCGAGGCSIKFPLQRFSLLPIPE